MLDVVSPQCEASISPELSRLVRALGRLGDDAGRSETQVAIETRDLSLQSKNDTKRNIWKDCALRRDGSRPVRFRGLMLYECDWTKQPCDAGCPSLAADWVLRLYVSYDSHLIAQVALMPTEEMGACPIFRVNEISDPDDFARVFRDVRATFLSCSPHCSSATTQDRQFPGLTLVNTPHE